MKQLVICILLLWSKSFAQSTAIGGLINQYTEVTALNFCTNTLTVTEPQGFHVGDTVLLIQMKGADHTITTSSSSYGDITSYNGAGNYEFNYVTQVTLSTIVLKNNLNKQYNVTAAGAVQLIRVPSYQNAIVGSTLTCPAWDGTSGGVVALITTDTLELAANIDVSQKGFKGGSIGTGFLCSSTAWANGSEGGLKGENIAKYTAFQDKGGAHLTNGGGGSFAGNTGAGGGGNFGAGGIGGREYVTCSGQRQSIGGSQLDYTLPGRIFFGGGGGGGEQDNGFTVYPGGRGGGLVIIKSNVLKASNNKIMANGESVTGVIRDEGGSGGGAGGSVLIFNNIYLGNVQVEANGGDGNSNNNVTYASQCHGPGGGGGGGVIGVSGGSLPINISFTANGGLAGKVLNPASSCFNTTNGAADGGAGGVIINQIFPATSVLFNKNIDSIRIRDSATACASFDFKGMAYTNTSGITNWLWDFGDGITSNLQNASHVYFSAGVFRVKLTVTDNNNCTDTISKLVNVGIVNADAGIDTTVCKNVSFTLHGSGNGTYAWTPRSALNDSTLQNPTAAIATTTKFYLKVTNALGCTGIDSITATVRPAPVFTAPANIPGCFASPVQLTAAGGNIYLWSPAALVSNATISNPLTTLTSDQLFTVKIKDSVCNDSTSLTTMVTLRPLPVLSVTKSNDVTCSVGSTTLVASGALQFTWSPSSSLNTTTGAVVTASPLASTTYYVSGADALGCKGIDSIRVVVNFTGKANYFMPNSFTPNGDGKNDCYGIKYFGLVQEFQLYIFNRLGERVFATNNPNMCWNGDHKGQPAEPGNYIYYIKAKTACGPVEKKGSLILMR